MNGTPMSRRMNRARAAVPAERVQAMKARQVQATVDAVQDVQAAVVEQAGIISTVRADVDTVRQDFDTLLP